MQNMAPTAGSLAVVAALSLSLIFHFSICYLAPQLLIIAAVTPVSWAPVYNYVCARETRFILKDIVFI
jgi:hypothetical protein